MSLEQALFALFALLFFSYALLEFASFLGFITKKGRSFNIVYNKKGK